MKNETYRIEQYAAHQNRTLLFAVEGTNVAEVRAKAKAMIEELRANGRVILDSLRTEKIIVPDNLENRMALGTGKERRKARRLMASGKYTGKEELSSWSGRWELPKR